MLDSIAKNLKVSPKDEREYPSQWDDNWKIQDVLKFDNWETKWGYDKDDFKMFFKNVNRDVYKVQVNSDMQLTFKSYKSKQIKIQVNWPKVCKSVENIDKSKLDFFGYADENMYKLSKDYLFRMRSKWILGNTSQFISKDQIVSFDYEPVNPILKKGKEYKVKVVLAPQTLYTSQSFLNENEMEISFNIIDFNLWRENQVFNIAKNFVFDKLKYKRWKTL